MNLNPVFTAAAIVVAVSVLGLIISYWRQSRLFRGYEEYTSDAQDLAGRLKAEVFRDRTDLVISGNYAKLPTIVRFSYADNTPGLNVRMRAPATFTMSVVPKGGRATEGRVLLRTPDDVFDSRFATRTDHPTQARIFVAGKAAFAQIQKLCCSSQTFLTLTSGGVELSELTIPSPYAAQHIQAHLDSMAALAQALQQMPGADAIKITPYKKEHSNIIRAALAVGVLTAIMAVVGAMYDRDSTAAVDGAGTTSQDVPAGVPLADAQRIGALAGFRLATASDFNDGAAWVRSQTGQEVSGHIDVAFTGDTTQDKAYVFVQDSGPNAGVKRVVLLVGNEAKYDAGYQELTAIGRVPHSNLAGIPWTMALRPPDGDGLLLVRKSDDPRSGTVIYFSGGRMETAVPTNYQNVGIQ